MAKPMVGASALIVALGLVALPSVAFAAPASDDNSETLSALVDKAAPDGGTPLGLTKKGNAYVGSTPNVTIEAPDTAGGNVSLSSTGSASSFGVGIPGIAGGAAAKRATNGNLTYDNSTSSDAIVVQPFGDGVRINTILKNTHAPTEYVYSVHVPEGSTITKDEKTGSIFVTSTDGKLLGGFASPWAKDANGTSVPTYYEVRGTTVVQVIDVKSGNYTYPIVADPYLWRDLIDHADWAYSSSGWTLQVYPTSWGRANTGPGPVSWWGWDELYSKYRDRGLNTNLTSMRNQYICHAEYAALRDPYKASWNLDEWRPNVGYLRTVFARCNP